MTPQQFHLLLVEDDDLDVMNVRRALSQVPEIASITVARDGVEALALLRSGELPLERLVIMDALRSYESAAELPPPMSLGGGTKP